MRIQFLVSLLTVFIIALTACTSPTPASEAPGLVGTFTNSGEELTFNEDGTWFIRWQNNGSFTVNGNQVTFVDEDNRSDSCPPDQEPGVYEWTLEGQTLTFTLVSDPCTTGRIEFFTIGNWQLQSQ